MFGGFGSIGLTLFFILNSTGNIPVFLALLGRFEAKKRLSIIARELFIALGILLLFTFFGDLILNLLGISQGILATAGGVLLFLISLGMIFPKPKTTPSIDAQNPNDEPLIIPLAMPLVAGPGAISMVMTYATETGRPVLVALALLAAWIPSLFILLASSSIKQILGERGLIAIERLGGMLLCLIGTSMFVSGALSVVKNYFHL